MEKKMVIYLNPNVRNAKAEGAGFSSEVLLVNKRERIIDGTFLLIDDRVLRLEEIQGYCESCSHPLLYNDEHDAEYCYACDEWQEDTCDDLTCNYCSTRPEKPSHCK